MQAKHVVGVIGGAVAGSEAAAAAADRGALVVVFEQNDRPYGKIEDGLPRWHGPLRLKEFARIDANLSHPNILFVPRTRVGEEVCWESLSSQLSLSAIVLANGAWRDRPIGLPGLERFEGAGFYYQNRFVHWFNHLGEPGHDDGEVVLDDGAIVIGGGLASVDVVKIINLELYARAARARGVELDVHAMERRGIPKTLAEHGLDAAGLGVRGATLYYRRRAEDMALASMADPTPEQLAKLQRTRLKILDKVRREFLVGFEGQVVARQALVSNGGLAGVVFQRVRAQGRTLVPVEGAELIAHSRLVVSAIGSLPEPLEGVPMDGDLYAYKDWATGELDAEAGVWGLGNALTGRGNIRESRRNARAVMRHLREAHLAGDIAGGDASTRAHAALRADAERLFSEALSGPAVGAEHVARVRAWVAARWRKIGYPGDYAAWIAAHPPRDRVEAAEAAEATALPRRGRGGTIVPRRS
ncbi:MAG: hypothetical protein CSA66_04405 [Proteobacteria bacterium]|nr:MAG: hypothetical protein CSA66_04405 [Pseudomonadota bacterium]